MLFASVLCFGQEQDSKELFKNPHFLLEGVWKDQIKAFGRNWFGFGRRLSALPSIICLVSSQFACLVSSHPELSSNPGSRKADDILGMPKTGLLDPRGLSISQVRVIR